MDIFNQMLELYFLRLVRFFVFKLHILIVLFRLNHDYKNSLKIYFHQFLLKFTY